MHANVGSVSGHDQFDVQYRKFSVFGLLAVESGALSVNGQMIFARFAGTLPEVQAPNAFRVLFYLKLVGRVAGRYYGVRVIVLETKDAPAHYKHRFEMFQKYLFTRPYDGRYVSSSKCQASVANVFFFF